MKIRIRVPFRSYFVRTYIVRFCKSLSLAGVREGEGERLVADLLRDSYIFYFRRRQETVGVILRTMGGGSGDDDDGKITHQKTNKVLLRRCAPSFGTSSECDEK